MIDWDAIGTGVLLACMAIAVMWGVCLVGELLKGLIGA